MAFLAPLLGGAARLIAPVAEKAIGGAVEKIGAKAFGGGDAPTGISSPLARLTSAPRGAGLLGEVASVAENVLPGPLGGLLGGVMNLVEGHHDESRSPFE